jgi:isoleucyl-tRNA synthetase
MTKIIKLFSVCVPCDQIKPYDGQRLWGDFDKCSKCNEIMDVWTESGVQIAARAALTAGKRDG